MEPSVIKNEIQTFLESEHPSVICIAGRWGIGKTHLWNECIFQAQKYNNANYKYYSYVSLFGINSLAELKGSIVENAVSIDNTKAIPDINTYKIAQSRAIELFRKIQYLGKQIQFGSIDKFSDSSQRIMFLLTQRQIVCLDDLERAGTGLSLKDVLGLVTQLAELKNCKVALLLNEEMLIGDSKGDFPTHLEKIVDKVLIFDPKPEEAAGIGLLKESLYFEHLKKTLEILNLNNIRTIKRIEAFASDIQNQMKGFDQSAINQAISIAALAVVSKFHQNDGPSLNFLINFSRRDGESSTAPDVSPQQEKFQSLFIRLGYNEANGFTRTIIQGINQGYVESDKLRSEASKLYDIRGVQKFRNLLHEAWNEYNDSFDGAEKIVEKFENAVKKNLNNMSVREVNDVIVLFRKLKEDSKADQFIELYIADARHDYSGMPPIPHNNGIDLDYSLSKALAEQASTYSVPMDLGKVLYELSQKRGATALEHEFVEQSSEDDFFQVFKLARGRRLDGIIRAALNNSTVSYTSNSSRRLTAAVWRALDRISSENTVNAQRVRDRLQKFGKEKWRRP